MEQNVSQMLTPIYTKRSFLYAMYYRYGLQLLWNNIPDGIFDSGIREFCLDYSVINSVQYTTQENRNADTN